VTRLSWLDSFGILGGGGLLSFALTAAVAFSMMSFAALRNRRTVLAQGNAPDSPELGQVLRFEPGMLAFRGERLDVAAEAGWALAELAGRAARQYVRLDQAVAPGSRSGWTGGPSASCWSRCSLRRSAPRHAAGFC
jgi:hypothetical protein